MKQRAGLWLLLRLAAVSASECRVHLVTFAQGDAFWEAQQKLDDSWQKAGLQSHKKWTSWAEVEDALTSGVFNRIDAEIQKKAAGIDRRAVLKGGFWKPMLTLDTLLDTEVGDLVLLHDASVYVPFPFRHNITLLCRQFDDFLKHEHFIVGTRISTTMEWEYEQRAHDYRKPNGTVVASSADQLSTQSLFKAAKIVGLCEHWAMATDSCHRRLLRTGQLQNSWTVWKHSGKSKHFLQEYLGYSLHPGMIATAPFNAQSILGVLAAKYDLFGVHIPHTRKLCALKHPGATVFCYSTGMKHINTLLQDIQHRWKVVMAKFTTPLTTDFSKELVHPVEWKAMTAQSGKEVAIETILNARIVLESCLRVPDWCCWHALYTMKTPQPPHINDRTKCFRGKAEYRHCCRGMGACWLVAYCGYEALCGVTRTTFDTNTDVCWTSIRSNLERMDLSLKSVKALCCSNKHPYALPMLWNLSRQPNLRISRF
mmetsp:Transcript_45784/g.83925  ORF Transcript_45784/g.83925 Transcript_45784/m.83925 type:complete len:482 (+) Transcript_45784:114-1559(+)